MSTGTGTGSNVGYSDYVDIEVMGRAKYPPLYVKHADHLRMMGLALLLVAVIGITALRWWRARMKARTVLVCVGTKARQFKPMWSGPASAQFVVGGDVGVHRGVQAPLLQGVTVVEQP